MQPRLLLILFTICLAFGRPATSGEEVIVNRIKYIYNLKGFINDKTWAGFTDKQYDLPLVYYTDSNCYLANPTPKFIAAYKPQRVSSKGGLEIYKTGLLNREFFNMQTNVTFGDDTTHYDHQSPFMNCSSYEITKKAVQDVKSVEEWTTMVLHEYFHGFQFKHAAFLRYFEKNIAAVPEDSLKKIYKAHPWFKESVDRENNLLLAALAMNNKNGIHTLVDSFLLLRGQRHRKTKEVLSFHITPIEQIFETMEGTARYAEHSLYSHFAAKVPDGDLVQTDTAYRSYHFFRNFNMEKEQWLYRTDKTTYFYATGFNLVRLFDKLGIRYKHRLFKEPGLSLELLLQQYRAK
jgi:hypothetical protein